ncbi:MAG: hypothetical protein AMXMBFR58_27050 [Phycisphaerae bacterium]
MLDAAVVLGVQLACATAAILGLAFVSFGVSIELSQAGFYIPSLLTGASAGSGETLREWAEGRGWGPVAGLGLISAFTGIWVGAMFGQRGVMRAFAIVAGSALVVSQVTVAVIRANSGPGGIFPGGASFADPAGTALLLLAGLIVAGGFVPVGLGAGAALRLLRRNVIGTLVRMERRRRRR